MSDRPNQGSGSMGPGQTESATVIYFVRHGLVYDPDLIVYGRLPHFRLDPVGLHQAEAAGRALAGRPIRDVFASPLLRARQTARAILAYHPGARLHVSRLLHEVHTPFEGKPRSQAEARRWDMYSGAAAGYEQPEHVLARTLKFVQAVRRQYAGHEVVAVTHGDVIAFLALWAQGELPAAHTKERYFPAPASISTFTFLNGRRDALPEFTYEQPY